MNKQRLLTLAAHLRDQVPEEDFSMATWAGNGKKPWNGTAVLSCGVAGCAMGYATTIPEFSDLGLHLASGGYRTDRAVISFKGHIGYQAAMALFEIDDLQSDWLFNPDRYNKGVTPTEVAERIEKIVADEGVCPEWDEDEED